MRGRRLAMTVLGAILLTSCGGPAGVSVPPGSESLPRCPTQTIPVADVPQVGAPGCNWKGSTVDAEGLPLLIDEAGVNNTASDPAAGDAVRWQWGNWGVPGIAVVKLTADRQVLDIWASTPQARELMVELLRVEGKSI